MRLDKLCVPKFDQVLVRINVPCSIQHSTESIDELLTRIPMLFQARVEQICTPLEFILAAPGEEIAHGKRESGGLATLSQRVGPAPN
jgi:hypothetical protein